MCRGFLQHEIESLKIKAFYIQLTVSCTKNKVSLPEFLSLQYLLNGSGVRPGSEPLVMLHRVLSKESGKQVVYGCEERVLLCEGARFDVYSGDVKVLKGIFRKDEGENWKMESRCDNVIDGVKCAEVCVAGEGPWEVEMSERVEMVVASRRRTARRGGELEEIPVEREEGTCVSCCCCECRVDGGDFEMKEGVRLAVDVGVWVVCLGVVYLVSRASSERLRKRKWI